MEFEFYYCPTCGILVNWKGTIINADRWLAQLKEGGKVAEVVCRRCTKQELLHYKNKHEILLFF